MKKHILTVSANDTDIQFGQRVSELTGYDRAALTDPEQISNYLIQNPRTLVLWDTDSAKPGSPSDLIMKIAPVLTAHTVPGRVFALSSVMISQHPSLNKMPVFGHFLLKRYLDPAPLIYSKIIRASLLQHPFGLSNYFDSETKVQRIELKKSLHKTAAVQAVENILSKRGIKGRISSLVANAVDELLMNAIYDAPIDGDGVSYRREVDRNSDLELNDRELVRLEVAEAEKYIGVCISDQFGSLSKDVVLGFLRKDYQTSEYEAPKGKSGGLGLHGIVNAGLSMLLVSRPDFKTEVMIFFPKLPSYKDFKSGFRFISVVSY